jgi:hypothetical protein
MIVFVVGSISFMAESALAWPKLGSLAMTLPADYGSSDV